MGACISKDAQTTVAVKATTLLNKYLSGRICNYDSLHTIFRLKLFFPLWNPPTSPAPPGIFPLSCKINNSTCYFVSNIYSE